MINVKINGKKYKIKTIPELTTEEFIELSELENLDTSKYISWQTGIDIKKTFFAIISKQVEKSIGKVPDIRKLHIPKWVNKKNIIETVGQRHQIENSNLKGYELLVFTLAVANAKSNNIDDVNELNDIYMQMPFMDILPAGFFFFKNYKNGKSEGRRLLNWLLGLIKISNLKNRQG
jgi:hypothetical protein